MVGFGWNSAGIDYFVCSAPRRDLCIYVRKCLASDNFVIKFLLFYDGIYVHAYTTFF